MKNNTDLIRQKILNYKKNIDHNLLIKAGYSNLMNKMLSNRNETDWILDGDRLYLNIDHWEADLYSQKEIKLNNKKKIVILGESVAQSYGWNPDYSFAKLLQENNPNYQVIDLSRISAQFTSLLNYEEIINKIKPEKVVIFGGNNLVTYTPNTPHIFPQGSSLTDIEDIIYKNFKKYIMNPFIERIKTWNEQIDISFIVPMANTRAFTPISKFAYNNQELEIIKSALELNDIEIITDIINNNNLICPVLFHHLAKLNEDNGNISKAYDYYDKSYFLDVDKKNTLPGINHIYRECFEQTLIKQDFNFISLHDLYQDDYRKYFSDYCHLNQKGTYLVAKEYSKKELNNNNIKDIKLSDNCLKKINTLFTLINLRNESYRMLKDNNIEFDNINILNLFDNSPFFINKTYQSLLRINNFKPILSHLDYKRRTPYLVKNKNLPNSINDKINTAKIKDNIINLLNPSYAYYVSRRKNIPDYKINFTKGVYGPDIRYDFPKYFTYSKLKLLIKAYIPCNSIKIIINDDIHIINQDNGYFKLETDLELKDINYIQIQLNEFNFTPNPNKVMILSLKDGDAFQKKFFDILKMEIMNEKN